MNDCILSLLENLNQSVPFDCRAGIGKIGLQLVLWKFSSRNDKDVDPATSPTTLHVWFSLLAIHSWTSIHTGVHAGSHSVLYTYFINNGSLEL